jgi:hypothetical protein
MILTKQMTTIAIYNVIQGSTSQKELAHNLKENLQSQTKNLQPKKNGSKSTLKIHYEKTKDHIL